MGKAVDPGAEFGRSRDAGLLLDAQSAFAPPSLAAATVPPPALLAFHTRNVSYSTAFLPLSMTMLMNLATVTFLYLGSGVISLFSALRLLMSFP